MPAGIAKGHVSACLAGAVCASMFTIGARADLWYTEPDVNLYGFYEDNIGLRTNDKEDSAGYIAQASLKGGRRSENTDINFKGEVERREFFQESSRNTNNFHFDGQAIRRIERDRFELNAAFDYDSTITSESTTSGRVQDNKRRRRWFVAPGWEHQLNERLSANVDASYQDIDYEDAGRRTGLFDYIYATVGGGLTYGLNERTQLLGRLSYDRYEADDIDNESDTYGILGGASYGLSETWSVTALLGERQSELRDTGGNDNSTGGQFDLSTRKQFETGTLNVGANRSIVPSGDGEVQERTGVNLSWNQQIVPRWRWLLNADAYRNEEPSGNRSGSDRDYVSVTPRLRYQLAREWSLDAGYRYRYQKYDDNSDSAQSNAVFFTLAYSPRRERPDLDLTR